MNLKAFMDKNVYYKNTEHLFGITSQIEDQCPLIDTIKTAISDEAYCVRECLDNVRSRDPDIDDLDRLLGWVDFNLRSIDVEQLRKNITELRNWGQGWKDLAKTIIEKNSIDFEKYID